MTRQQKAIHIVEMIEQLIAARLGEHERRHHPTPDAAFHNSVEEQAMRESRVRSFQEKLVIAISDLV
jgi:hypothetical protein